MKDGKSYRRGPCSCGRKIRHIVHHKTVVAGSRGVPRCQAARCLLPAANFMSHNVLLSERANLSLFSSGRALPAQDVTARPWPTPRSTSSLARARPVFLSGSEPIFQQRQRSLLVLPVAAARRDGRERHSNLFVSSLPDSATNDATGRLILFCEQARVTAGRLAFIFAAGMTARGCEHSGRVS